MEIESALLLRDAAEGPRPPVLQTTAANGEGIPALCEAIATRLTGDDRRASRLEARARFRLQEALTTRLRERLDGEDQLRAAVDEAVRRVAARDVDPYTAAEELWETLT